MIADDKRLLATKPLGLLVIYESRRGGCRSGGPIGGQQEEGLAGLEKARIDRDGRACCWREAKGEDSLRRRGEGVDISMAGRIT